MKRLAFRIYDPVSKKFHHSGSAPSMLAGYFKDTATLVIVHQMEHQQETNLRDKNGVEIYEGDYLVCRKYIGGNFVENVYEKGSVGFKNGSFYLVRKEGHFRPLSWLTEFDYEFEVRGNIYDNPELLEGEEAV